METDNEQLTSSNMGIAMAIGLAIVALLLALFATGRALAGTPGSDGPGPAAQASVIEVELSEFAISPSPILVAAGDSLSVVNDGAAEHNLKVRDSSVGTADLQAGDSETLSLASLSAGTYEVFCEIAGHEAAGMVAALTVGEGGGAAAAPGDAGEQLTGMARAEWLRANYEESIAAFPAETELHGNQIYEGEVQADGTTLFELTISRFEWETEPGVFVEAIGYNNQVPGPTMKADVGETVTVRVINGLDDESTSLYPHGIFMHPLEADGIGYISHDPIMPGDIYEVTFTTQEPSVGMYHGHDNGVGQVIDGAFGAWLVGQMPLPSEATNVVDEKVMVLNDAGAIGLTLNAKSFPATEPYVLKKGQQMLLHYYNEGLTAHPMHLHNNAQLVIAKDGYPLAQPYYADTVNIAPGERYSVVIFAEVPGTWVYHCHILTHVEKDDGSVFGMFTALIVEESGDPELDAQTARIAGNGRAGAPAPIVDTPGDSGAAADGSADG